MTFEDTVAPIAVGDFLERFLSRDLVIVPGHASKFSDLVPWGSLNEVLSSLRVAGTRIKLFKDGAAIDNARFLEDIDNPSGTLLRSRETTQLLRDGATLIVNQADELFPALRTLLESCEDQFRIVANANLYAAWRAQKGFDLHWDDHDTLILQVSGRKKWDIYRPTREFPIQGDVTGTPARPVDPPVWSGILAQGDLLYMPRGWWHVACPMDEPTLHLTIGLRHPRGVDLLQWLVAQLYEYVDIRMPLPHIASSEAQLAYAETLRRHVSAALHGDIVEEFMRATDRKARPRPRFRLPDSVVTDNATVRTDTALRLSSMRRLHCEVEDGTGRLAFKVGAKAWTCDVRFLTALEMLRQSRSCRFDVLGETVGDGLRLPLRMFLELLVKDGVIAVV